MLPDSRSGTTSIWARPATSDLIPLMRAASLSTALSKASGPSRSPPVICPRSVVLQSAAASIVDGIFDVTVSTADRIATLGNAAEVGLDEQINRILDNVRLAIEIRKNVDCGVSDEHY